MNPFEPPADGSSGKHGGTPIKTRIVALGLVAAGVWYAYFAFAGYRVGLGKLVAAGLCFVVAWLAWK